MESIVLDKCQKLFPDWRRFGFSDFTFTAPKGFSSYTMAIRCLQSADPPAVFYRHLADKENGILDFDTERTVFLTLGEHEIATGCLHYAEDFRLEEFYEGRTLTRHDLVNPKHLRGIADELYRLHQLSPEGLPEEGFFELLRRKWGGLARHVLVEKRGHFPDEEQRLCKSLEAIYSEATAEKVAKLLPKGPLTFCHNDTYHGNVMLLSDGRIKLLDFEFSCLNHRAFDFANIFAETVTRHGLPEPPHFSIEPPTYTAEEIGLLIDCYLDNQTFPSSGDRGATHRRLVSETEALIPLSDYMYAMAALPLALEPIQKIRFIPYAFQRFQRFLNA